MSTFSVRYAHVTEAELIAALSRQTFYETLANPIFLLRDNLQTDWMMKKEI